ncbi:MAG: hypothetical protein HY259_02720 [Chloroflexi bacterium]|nr:hypothetical protein [Chloroflexota bacterium]
MKGIHSAVVILLLVCQTQLSLCSASMPLTTAAPDTLSRSPSAAAPTASHLTANAAGCEVLPGGLSLSSLNSFEPIGQFRLASAPTAYRASVFIIDPPPRWSLV